MPTLAYVGVMGDPSEPLCPRVAINLQDTQEALRRRSPEVAALAVPQPHSVRIP